MESRTCIALTLSLGLLGWMAIRQTDVLESARSSRSAPTCEWASPLTNSSESAAPPTDSHQRSALPEPVVGSAIESVAEPTQTHDELSWDDVEANFLASMPIGSDARDTLQSELVGGPLDVDTDWIERRFGSAVSGVALHDAHVRAIEMNLEIGVASSEYLDELDRAVRLAIRDGRFVKGAGDIAEPPASRSVVYMQHSRMGRWSTMLSLGRDEHPQLSHLQARVRQMVNDRDQEIARILRGG